MQCYSDLNLKCCDCKSTFTSASQLLKHFSEHVQKEIKSRLVGSKSKDEKKRKACEEVSQGESGSDSSQSRQESTLSANSCSSSDSQPCKLAKFDLQKRLESCVSNGVTVKPEPDTCVAVKLEEDEDSNGLINTCAADTKVEEISPLKFCMITMEESDRKYNAKNSPKKIASRKQLLPKKIERKVDAFRKIAPKVESAVISNETLLQSPGRKKYACHLCTKVFGWSTDLKRHILVHTGERPFKCENCQATFTRNFLLQKHQSKVHPCKPKESIIKLELVEMPSVTVAPTDEYKTDPLKDEPVESDSYNNDVEDDDDDDEKLIITEDIDEKPSNTVLCVGSTESPWSLKPNNADRCCSDMKQSDIFKVAPVKVLTM